MNEEDWRYLWRIRDRRDRKKVNIRWMDRWYFRKMLPKAMYDTYEIHHDWANGAVCYLFTPWRHRGAKYKGNKKNEDGGSGRVIKMVKEEIPPPPIIIYISLCIFIMNTKNKQGVKR